MAATTTLVVGNEQLSISTFNHRKKVVNTRNMTYPVAEHWLKAKEKAEGETLVQPFDYRDHSRPTRLVTGYERYDDFIQTTLMPGTIGPAWLAQPVMISDIDRTKNSGASKQVDLAKQRTENVEMHLRRQIQEVVLKGAEASGTYRGHPAWIGWNSLNGMDNSKGYLEAAASGTNTYYGISKAQFPAVTHPLLHNLWIDLADDAGGAGLDALYQLSIDMEIRSGSYSGSQFKWYVSSKFAGFLKRVMRPMEQYSTDGDMDDSKRRVSTINGIPIYPVLDLPQAGSQTTGNPWSAVLVDWSAFRPALYSGWDFHMTKWKDIPGTVDVQAALFKIGGQNMSGPAGTMALVTSGEVF